MSHRYVCEVDHTGISAMYHETPDGVCTLLSPAPGLRYTLLQVKSARRFHARRCPLGHHEEIA